MEEALKVVFLFFNLYIWYNCCCLSNDIMYRTCIGRSGFFNNIINYASYTPPPSLCLIFVRGYIIFQHNTSQLLFFVSFYVCLCFCFSVFHRHLLDIVGFKTDT